MASILGVRDMLDSQMLMTDRFQYATQAHRTDKSETFWKRRNIGVMRAAGHLRVS